MADHYWTFHNFCCSKNTCHVIHNNRFLLCRKGKVCECFLCSFYVVDDCLVISEGWWLHAITGLLCCNMKTLSHVQPYKNVLLT